MRNGYIVDAKRLYARFAKLMRLLANRSLAGRDIELHLRLTQAEVHIRGLALRHTFSHKALAALALTNPEPLSEAGVTVDSDPYLRSLAILKKASSKYQIGEGIGKATYCF